jgi:hypothetical protein
MKFEEKFENLESINKWLKPLPLTSYTITHGLNRGLKKRNFLHNRFNGLPTRNLALKIGLFLRK